MGLIHGPMHQRVVAAQARPLYHFYSWEIHAKGRNGGGAHRREDIASSLPFPGVCCLPQRRKRLTRPHDIQYTIVGYLTNQ